jgi:hypothetical protein
MLQKGNKLANGYEMIRGFSHTFTVHSSIISCILSERQTKLFCLDEGESRDLHTGDWSHACLLSSDRAQCCNWSRRTREISSLLRRKEIIRSEKRRLLSQFHFLPVTKDITVALRGAIFLFAFPIDPHRAAFALIPFPQPVFLSDLPSKFSVDECKNFPAII